MAVDSIQIGFVSAPVFGCLSGSIWFLLLRSLLLLVDLKAIEHISSMVTAL
jgi:hypothetical protein